MAYPTFLEFIRARYGENWCIAHRLTARLRSKGYEVAVHPATYEKLRLEWANGHPAFLLALSLPDSDEKWFICKAVLRELV